MVNAEVAGRAKTLIDELSATTRFAGSDEETRARTRCRRELEAVGFSCQEMPFRYSQWLARWAVPLVSLGLGLLAFGMARLALVVSNAWPESITLWAFVLAALASGRSLATGWVLRFPWSRAFAVNLEARRGNPSVWLVAHLDSKSQTIPMLLRIAGSISLYAAGMLVAMGGLAFRIWGSPAAPALIIAQPLALFGAVTAGLCFIRNESPGAVDNASGVAAVLLAAQSTDTPQSLGVLITSGEELGLAGAVAWAKTAPDNLMILNCDTVDEAGAYRCMYTVQPARLADAIQTAARRLNLDVKLGRMIPGIMADSMAFTNRWRWSAITLSRGTLATLARIHTRRDNSAMLTGEGAAQASALLSAIARELS
jgi:hypothetical protein